MTPVDTTLLNQLLADVKADGITKTVVGAVITNDEEQVLLLHRVAGDYLGGLWELPSGGVDKGESLLDALGREVKEETGLFVTAVIGYLGHFDYLSGSGRNTRQFNFTATAVGPITLNPDEHDEHMWADAAQQTNTSTNVQEILALHRQHS